MTLYKLTDANGRTYGDMQWGPGIEHTASGDGELCGLGWIHAYTHPLLAVFLNRIHADFKNPLLWECDGDIGATDHGLKVGCTRLKTLFEMPMPVVSESQRVRFAILCAQAIIGDGCPQWSEWAAAWLSAADAASAWSAADAARSAAGADAAWSAADAARSAASAKPLDLIAIAKTAMEKP